MFQNKFIMTMVLMSFDRFEKRSTNTTMKSALGKNYINTRLHTLFFSVLNKCDVWHFTVITFVCPNLRTCTYPLTVDNSV